MPPRSCHLPIRAYRCARALLLAGPLLALLAAPAAPGEEKAGGDVQAQLAALLASMPAESGFAFSALTESGPKRLYGSNADVTFAIGSSFKLYILGRLAHEVNQRHGRLDDTMRLAADLVGPPHSEMAEWPLGSPVTLQTLALKMIMISDNTATDHLLQRLGRENVEAQMAVMGHRHPERNRPLLFTREMVMLRDRKVPSRGSTWKGLDEAGRRAFLAEDIAGLHDFEAVDFDAGAYDLAEWYASPTDMALALDWIRRHTQESDRAHALRGVMAVTTQIPFDPSTWPYVGFKGGSEDQLLAGNWLMQHRDGRWFAFNVAINKPDGKIDQRVAADALTKMVEVFEASLEE